MPRVPFSYVEIASRERIHHRIDAADYRRLSQRKKCPEYLFFDIHASRKIPQDESIQAVAAVSTMDARMLQIQPFAEHFGLSTKNIETFQDEYSRILNGQFKGTMGNLPKDLYSDTIWTFIKGPHVPPFACCTLYSAGPNDQVIFQPTKEFDESHGIMESNLLSDWWNPTVN